MAAQLLSHSRQGKSDGQRADPDRPARPREIADNPTPSGTATLIERV